MKVVLDTNCILQIVFPKAAYQEVWKALIALNLITADPDDNKFVDCAVTAGATYIVSNDHHFEELKHYQFPQVDVRTLTEFLNIVRTL